jgi:heat shock protein HslJ
MRLRVLNLDFPEKTMRRYRWRAACWIILAAVCSSHAPAVAAESTFPFDRELILDAAPMRGSKRIPILQIAENGAATIDLWCASLEGQATVGSDTITIVPGVVGQAQCVPERVQRDEELLVALSQVTSWRRNGDIIEFIGATRLRFRLMTN